MKLKTILSSLALLVTYVAVFFVGGIAMLAYNAPKTPLEISNYQDALEKVINSEREKQLIPSLKHNEDICMYAEIRVVNMESDYSHDRFTKFAPVYANYIGAKTMGENLTSQGIMITPQELTERWMTSQPHKQAMLNPQFSDTCVRCSDNYCVQIFAGF